VKKWLLVKYIGLFFKKGSFKCAAKKYKAFALIEHLPFLCLQAECEIQNFLISFRSIGVTTLVIGHSSM
jgi:hypothetical protein